MSANIATIERFTATTLRGKYLSGKMASGIRVRTDGEQKVFDSIVDAGIACRANGIDIADNEIGVGFKLGELIVAISETPLILDEVVTALCDSTDEAYKETAHKLARAIIARFGVE